MRHTTLTSRLLLFVTGTLLVLGSGGIAIVAASSHGVRRGEVVERDQRVDDDLREVTSCWGSPRHEPASTLPALGGATQTISVTVEPVSLLRLDSTGKVAAAATNTGCAPRSTDRIFVVQPDGSLVERPDFDVASVDWRGDFTDFGYIPQR